MSDNEYNDAATRQMLEVINDENMDAETKAKAVGFWIDCRADVNAIYHRGDFEYETYYATALHFASRKGYKELVELLIEKGAVVNQKDDGAVTALHCASSCGHKEIVERLLEKGADINQEDNRRWTALHYASCCGHKEIVELLIEKGAVVNQEGNERWPALHIASLNGHDEIVKLLIEKGADVNTKTKLGGTALMEASKEGQKEVVEMLLEKGADIEAKNHFRKTALVCASENGHKEVVEMLLEKGTDVNQVEAALDCALMNYGIVGYGEIVEILENKMQELKAKEEVKKKIEAIKENKLKEEQEKENKFTKMIKGEMYRLDIDKLPEVSLCGEINVKLADYKKDLEALQSGEMLTFGRTKNEDETIEIDRGEKLVSFENKSNHVSRKHLSVVNFGGNLYMQDRSLNGTAMREVSKTDKAKSFVKPMDKER